MNEKLSSMPTYAKNLADLKKITGDLNSGKRCFSVGKNGQWQVTNEADGLVDRLLYNAGVKSAYKLEKLPSAFCQKYLYPLEHSPVLFAPEEGLLNKCKGALFGPPAVPSKRKEQKEYFETVIGAATAIEKAIIEANIKDCERVLLPLQAAKSSFKYRIEAENGGLNPLDPSQVVVDKTLRELAAKWKAAEKNYPVNDRGLIDRDEAHFKEICRYPDFVKILLKFPKLQETYFKWSIRDNGSERPFIEFMNFWHTKLDSNFLTSRIAYHGSAILGINKKTSKKSSDRKKVLTLPIEVMSDSNKLEIRNKNILNLSKVVTLNKYWKITIDKIFSIFGNKNLDVGNLEFFGKGGIKNWNNHKGYWNPATEKHEFIDLTAPRWWEQLPTMDPVNPVTRAELQRRYEGLNDLKSDEWVVIVRSTRKNPTLDITDAHGFVEVAIPQGDGTYKLYDFGKLVEVFPNGIWALLKFLANTVKAKIFYPDENIYYNFRQHAAWAKRLVDKIQIDKLMDMLKELFVRSEQGNLEFSFGFNNCSREIQHLMEQLFGEKNIPDFFKTSIFDLRLPQPLQVLFSFVRWLPVFLQSLWVKGIVLVFGGWRGLEVTEKGKRVFKNLTSSPFYKSQCNYLPSKLNHQILNKKIQGSVWFGVK